jgi:hypothetical protein
MKRMSFPTPALLIPTCSNAQSGQRRKGLVDSSWEKATHTAEEVEQEKKKITPCRGEGSAAGLQLRARFVPAALLAMLRAALALQCVSKARDWTGHVDR